MKELFAGLEEARKDFNRWQGEAQIKIDFEDMTAWTDVVRKDYESNTIFTLIEKDDLHGRDDKYGFEVMEAMAQTAINYKDNLLSTENDGSFEDYQILEEFRRAIRTALFYIEPVKA